MSNTQKLSPQGYNIQDAPTNTNPFWDQEGGGGGGAEITIDDALSLSSRNPVENRVITQALIETQDGIPDTTGLDNRITTAEAEIEQIQTKDATQDAAITAQGARITTAEADIDALEAGKQNKLTAGANITIVGDVISSTGGGGSYTFDTTPTQGSTNPVTSGGVYTALREAEDTAINAAEDYADAIGATKQDTLTFDTQPIYNSRNPVTSSGVRAADVYNLQLAKDYADDIGDTKQDKLTAGTGIDITGNVISSTGGITWESLGTFAFSGAVSESQTRQRLSLGNNFSALKTPGNHIISMRPVSVGQYTETYIAAPLFFVSYYVPQSIVDQENVYTTASGFGTSPVTSLYNGQNALELNLVYPALSIDNSQWFLQIAAQHQAGDLPEPLENNVLYMALGHIKL